MIDSLKDYEPKGSGLFLRFEANKSVKLRVLTLDPLVAVDKWGGTKYSFTVWNWDEDKAQVWSTTPGVLKKLTNIHRDEDLEPLNKLDIKITATGENLERRYEVVPLPKAQTITQKIVDQAKEIELEDVIKDNMGRLSAVSEEDAVGGEPEPEEPEKAPEKPDEELTDEEIAKIDSDEPINLQDIPF